MSHLFISRRYFSKNFTAFTLVELLVVIAIIAILAGILLPVTGKIRDNAKSTQTLSNLRQLYMANISYATDNNGVYVSAFDGGTWGNGWKWNSNFIQYLGAKATGTSSDASAVMRSGFTQPSAIISYNCPKVPSSTGSGSSYYWTSGAKMSLRANQLEQPSKTVAFIDTNDWWVNPDQWNAWKSASTSDKTNNPAASVAYRNNGKAAAITYSGAGVMLERKDLDKSSDEGKWRWFYDGKS